MSESQVPADAIPGWDKILSGVNVKTAAWSDAASIGNRLYDAPDSSSWETQELDLVVDKTKKIYKFSVPPNFQVASLNDFVKKDFVGQDRDHYMTALVGQLGIQGSYGGFSGTLKFQFDMTEDTTEANSFGTHTDRWRLYSLKAPPSLDYSSTLLNNQFVSDLYGNKAIPVQDFYAKWGTHFTSDIIIGGGASLSVYSQYKKTYERETFSADISLAYDTIVASFQTTGEFNYTSESSQESYSSSSALVLQGGDPTTADKLPDWLATVADSPAFLDFNQEDPTYAGLTPMYALIPNENDQRRQELKKGLDDYLYPPLHLRIFAAASTQTEFPEVTVSVPGHYKVLSGGALVSWTGVGELLTASFPPSTSQWSARARDCSQVDYGQLTVFAIGVYDPYDWLEVKIVPFESKPSEAPTASVSLDPSYAMTGGGADCKTDSTGNQIYLTASYPYSQQDPRNGSFSSNTWYVAGKDAFVATNAPISAYAVGVKWSSSFSKEHPAQPPITTECLGVDSSFEAHPEASLGPPDDTILVGGGAYDRWQNPGNMLTDSYPKNLSTWSAAGKDHMSASSATLTVYAIGVKNMVPPPSTATVGTT